MKIPAPTSGRWTLDDLLHTLGPTIVNPVAKQRTKARVLEHVTRRHRPAPRWLAATVLIASSAAAAATLQHITSDAGAGTEHERPPRVVHGSTAPARSVTANPRPEITARSEPDLAPIEAATSESLSTRAPEPRSRSRVPAQAEREPTPAGGSTLTRRTVAAPSGEDPTQVVQALRALRKESRPERAQSLLSQYLTENPDGALAEEALALSIEASLKRHPARAAGFARQYLKRFPQGRFRALAVRTSSSSR